MANDSSGLRREFVAGVGTVIVAAVAGCSSIGDTSGDGENSRGEGNGGGNSEPTDTETSTDKPDAEENNSTPTEEETGTQDNETSNPDENTGSSDLYQEDESQFEAEWEDRWLENGYPNDAWLEMENPSEQIPEENYDFNEFPNLQIFEEIDLYSEENEAVYLTWQGLDGRISIGAVTIETYDNPSTDENTTSDGSHQYTDQSADMERILGEVIEEVDDVSENISEEYVELLT